MAYPFGAVNSSTVPCAGRTSEFFGAERPGRPGAAESRRVRAAKALCMSCHLRDPCYSRGLETWGVLGTLAVANSIWGGRLFPAEVPATDRPGPYVPKRWRVA
jgi:hypothetical protein